MQNESVTTISDDELTAVTGGRYRQQRDNACRLKADRQGIDWDKLRRQYGRSTSKAIVGCLSDEEYARVGSSLR
jgi:hypothetical protein